MFSESQAFEAVIMEHMQPVARLHFDGFHACWLSDPHPEVRAVSQLLAASVLWRNPARRQEVRGLLATYRQAADALAILLQASQRKRALSPREQLILGQDLPPMIGRCHQIADQVQDLLALAAPLALQVAELRVDELQTLVRAAETFLSTHRTLLGLYAYMGSTLAEGEVHPSLTHLLDSSSMLDHDHMTLTVQELTDRLKTLTQGLTGDLNPNPRERTRHA